MGRKQQFTSHDLLTMVTELRSMGVSGGFAQQFYDYGTRGIVIKISSRTNPDQPRKKYYLMMESGSRLHLIDSFTAIRPTPTGFCGKLRKHLKERQLSSINLINRDRVVDFGFGFETDGYHLILELYASGNIILTDHEYNIMMLLHNHRYSEEVVVKVGHPYPKEQATVDPKQYELTYSDLINQLEHQLTDKRQKLRQMLLRTQLMVFGPVLIDHGLAKFGIRKNQKLSLEDVDTLPNMEPVLEEIKIIHQTPGTDPYMVLDSDGNPESFVPTCYAHLKDKPMVMMDSFNRLVTEYFSQADERIKEKKPGRPGSKQPSEDTDKNKKYLRIDQQIDRLAASHREAEEMVEAFSTRVDEVQLFLNEYNEQKKTRMSNFRFPIVAEDHLRHTVTIQLDRFKIRLDTRLTGYGNLSGLHQNRKKLDYKTDRTKQAKADLIKMDERKRRKRAGPLSGSIDTSGLKPKKQHWYENYHWFVSSEGYLVVVGKTAQQNEELVKRYMEDHDIYVHSGVAGSGSGIIKTDTSDEELTAKTLQQAGGFVICHTRAWKSGVPDRPWWVKPSQVSKTAESGEYLTTGSFIIRGKKNMLAIPKLELGLTFLFKNSGTAKLSTRANSQLEYVVPMVAPYSSIKGVRAKLVPGNIKAGKAIKRIIPTAQKRVTMLEWAGIKRISNDDLNRVMVSGVKWFPFSG